MSLGAEKAGFHIGPGPTLARLSLLGRKAAVEFLALLFGERERLGFSGDAIPNVPDELNALGDAQLQDPGKGIRCHAER